MAPSHPPPWITRKAWRASCRRVRQLIENETENTVALRHKAIQIRFALASLEGLMQELCAATCPYCPDPCCIRAFPWHDLKDLAVLSLTGGPLPMEPVRHIAGSGCSHLGPHGCLLPRISRPWLCTWYLCPPQASRLKAMPGSVRNAHAKSLALIKSLRREVADILPDR